jgi:hypothetical protein
MAVGVAAVWLAGYAVARSHGVLLPPGTRAGFPILELPLLLGRSLSAALNLEDLPGLPRELLTCGYLVLAGTSIFFFVRDRARRKPDARRLLPPIAIGWFVLGVLPLAMLLPNWNSWRAWVPSLGLVVAFAAFVALVSPRLLAAFVGLRLLTLLLAPTAPGTVTKAPPETTSEMSFVRLVRLQRTVASTRRELLRARPTLLRGSRIAYWDMPPMARIGFDDSLAVRTWYRDSTLLWHNFGGEQGLGRQVDVMVQFVAGRASPASIVDPEAVSLYQKGIQTLMGGARGLGDMYLALAAEKQSSDPGPFTGSILMNRAIVAFLEDKNAAADSFNRRALELRGETADYWALEAMLAHARGDRDAAVAAVRRCLALDPHHAQIQALAQELGVEAP